MRPANGYRRAYDPGIEDHDLRSNVPLVDPIVLRVHQLDDGVSGFQMQRLPVRRYDRELPAQQDSSVDHRMAVRVKSGSRRNADPPDRDLRLTLRIRWQRFSIPAPRSHDELFGDDARLARLLPGSNRRTAGLQEENDADGRDDPDGMFQHGSAFSVSPALAP